MFAIVGFGMNAADPIEPTMLMTTDMGVGAGTAGPGAGAGGSSNARNPPPPGADSGFTADGDAGIVPPLQLHIAMAQATMKAGNATLVRMPLAQQSRYRANL